MTISTVPTKTLKDFINGQGYGVAPSAVVAICEELLAVREAQPVAWQERWSGGEWSWCTKSTFDYMSANHDPIAEVRELFTAPPAPALPSELLDAMAEVIRISDRDHEAWNRAKAAISACRAAKPVAPIEMTGALAMTKYGIKRSNYTQWVKGWNACRAAMLQSCDAVRDLSTPVDTQIAEYEQSVLRLSGNAEPVSQGYTFDGLNIRAVAALREAVKNQWLKSEEFADKVYWQNMHSIANEIIEAMAAAPTPTHE